MYGILGEDETDIDTLKVLIRRISGTQNLKIRQKPYGGCGDLLKNGHRDVKVLKALGCSRIIICYDSDAAQPQVRYQEIVDKIIKKSGITATFCALVPVQEIEAWLLADLSAVSRVISSVRISKKFSNPEAEANPKETLEYLCRRPNSRPIYTNTLHNKGIAEHLDLRALARLCPSSLPLFELVQKGIGNYPPIPSSSPTQRINAVVSAIG